MTEMNSLLGDVFGTKTASAQYTDEDLVKEANLQFFGELCQAEGIDLNQLNDDQTTELFKVAMAIKEAAEEEGQEEEKKEEGGKAPPFGKKHEDGESKEKEEKEEAKKEAAVQEWAEKRAAAVKVAEAEATGRIMAHAMVDELNKIAAALNGGQAEEAPATDSVEKAAALVSAFNEIKTASGAASNSSTPNFDELAAVQAVDLLKEAGHDEDVAFARINAIYTLGLEESTKIASASTAEDALTVRSLEFCEAAGFNVDWSQV